MTAKIKLNAASGGGSVSLQAPTSTTGNANVEFKLPVADGTSGQALTTDASGQLAFATVAVGGSNNIAFNSGNGIDFSATSDASGKTSELLDDYEEGTWTPSISSGGGGINGTGTYTKIGNMVHVRIEDGELTGTRNSDTLQISTLPFVPSKWTPGSMYARYYNAEGTDQVCAAVPEGATYFKFQEFGNETIGTDFNNGYLVFNVLYRTA